MYDVSDYNFAWDELRKALINLDIDKAQFWWNQMEMVHAELVFQGVNTTEIW